MFMIRTDLTIAQKLIGVMAVKQQYASASCGRFLKMHITGFFPQSLYSAGLKNLALSQILRRHSRCSSRDYALRITSSGDTSERKKNDSFP